MIVATAYVTPAFTADTYCVNWGQLDENGIEVPFVAVTCDSRADAEMVAVESMDIFAKHREKLSLSSFDSGDGTGFWHNVFYYLAISQIGA